MASLPPPTHIGWGDTAPPHLKGCATVANDKNNRYHLLGHPPRTRVRGVYAVAFRKNPPFSSRNPLFAHCTPFPYNEPEHGTNKSASQVLHCTSPTFQIIGLDIDNDVQPLSLANRPLVVVQTRGYLPSSKPVRTRQGRFCAVIFPTNPLS